MNPELINVFQSFESWKEALTICSQSLVKLNYITEGYIQQIIDNTLIFGPYYVIDEYIAIAHAPIDHQTVLKTGISWNNILQPIIFETKDIKKEVKILIILSTVSVTDHQELLKKIALFLMNKQNKTKVLSITNKIELIDYLKNIQF